MISLSITRPCTDSVPVWTNWKEKCCCYYFCFSWSLTFFKSVTITNSIQASYVTLNHVHELTNNTTSLFFCWERLGRREGGEVQKKAAGRVYKLGFKIRFKQGSCIYEETRRWTKKQLVKTDLEFYNIFNQWWQLI